MTSTEINQLSELLKTMRRLRSKDGCPWDQEQTPESLRPFILEEAYELIDAIDSGDTEEIRAELGDLLLQVIFQAQIYSERGMFGIGEIAEGINSKLQRRHPLIFSTEPKSDVAPDWEQIKREELREKGKSTQFAARQPVNLPSLKLADKCCRHLSKHSASKESLVDSERPPDSKLEISKEEEIAEGLFNLVCQAQKQEIDSDLALRKYVLKLLKKAEQIGHK